MKQHRIYEAAANADMMEADFDTQPEPISRVANAEAKSKENLAAPAQQQQRSRPVLQRQNAVRFGLKDAGLVGGDSEDVILPAPENGGADSAPGGSTEASPRDASDGGSAAAAQQNTEALQRRIAELEGQLRPQGLDGKSDARGAAAGAGGAAPADASTDRRNGTDDAAQGSAGGSGAGQDSVWDVSLGRGQRRLVVATWNLGRIRAKIGQRTLEKYLFKYDGYAQALYLEERKFWRAPGVCAIVLGLVGLACSLAFGTFRRSAAKAGGREP
ncbi:hypothetical protein JKP88DRAFT_231785 [Tribonema minus]|uniref:Uncharacterized protein n=1 Tax=Tribonema minus TaxID=303371 RepID=A0A836CLD6_9STRA|nr:hypothetical protein JKP88DRAFT_231785 [Tribonema minus]